jgi:hypothetical protein
MTHPQPGIRLGMRPDTMVILPMGLATDGKYMYSGAVILRVFAAD